MLATNGSDHSRDPWGGLLGYLNFSSGAHDPQFFQALNCAFAATSPDDTAAALTVSGPAADGGWLEVVDKMAYHLARLQRERESFADSRQAQNVLSAVRRFVPAYLAFHRDLLFHQAAEDVFNSFMLGRVMECLLQRHPWEDEQIAVQQAIQQLNDFIGYRPIPVLESHRIEPRPHEKVRPVPWYVADAGVAVGKYSELIGTALEILQQTGPELCERSWFHLDHLDELAVDPRAYDFDHPVNKRPNYHFGEWDPHVIDQRGHYRRFVVREVTLRALLHRVQDASRLRLPREELVWEAAAVLAGTILMSSAITGDGPETHDSNMTLSKLIPRIAACRDEFYDRLLQGVKEKRGERLRRETKSLHQAFGGARQHLNSHLALQRARQLEHARLARVFSRMGYLNAAQRQADVVYVPSARIVCRIDCRLTACHHALRDARHADVLEHLDQVLDLMHRGIDCGALVDPWNIIGFNGQYSLFPAMENSVYDHRVDDLLRVTDEIFDVLARLWSSASAADDQSILPAVASRYEETAQWWNQFAAHEVQAVETLPPLEGLRAARDVSHALGEWHRAGAVAGDVAFWAPHVQSLESPKPYALIVETLLSRNDYVSSQSVLVHWLSRSATLPLESRGASFHDLMVEWVQQIATLILSGQTLTSPRTEITPGELLCKFFDYLEANADEFWEVPEFEMHSSRGGNSVREEDPFADDAADDEEEEDLFQAAYENVVFQDSTDDGIEAEIVDRDYGDDDALEEEVTNCQPRLLFLHTLSRIWRVAAMALARATISSEAGGNQARFLSAITMWHERCVENRRELLRLMNQVHSAQLSRYGHDVDSMARYDRQRWLKESLLEQAILSSVKMASAELALRAARTAIAGEPVGREMPARTGNDVEAMTAELGFAAGIITAAIRQDRATAEQLSETLIEFLPAEEILYAPLGRGGTPCKMTEVRIRQQYIQDVLIALPRLGLVRQTLELIDTIREMEKNVPQGHGAVTQYDDMFEVGFVELVNVLVRSSGTRQAATDDQDADTVLISCLEQLAESALSSWLQHSQTLRLSVLERVRSGPEWKRLVEFIEKYGDDIFSQEFLHLGNVRAILHFGTENWVRELDADPTQEGQFRLISALGREISWEEAARRLTLILEAISENYDEYRDYNSTTTRSDRGSNLHVLLDFLRLRADYDRIAWNLRPVILAHRALVRSHRSEAAQLWRRLLHERLGTEADSYQRKLLRLQRKYAVRLGTISQRIGERFLQPMTIDRMQSLVESAMQQLRDGVASHAFEILEEEAELFMRESQNGGISVPKWLAALEEEVERLDSSDLFKVHGAARDDELLLEPIAVPLHDLQVQLTDEDEELD